MTCITHINHIAKNAKIAKTAQIGFGNLIGSNVHICDNVIIGNNNRIYSDTILYPNTIVGDNNTILNEVRIGEHPVNMNFIEKKKYMGVRIGSRNTIHARATLFGGDVGQTQIGDDNRISYAAHIGHDSNISSNVQLFPNCIVGGHSILLPYSGIGIGAGIHQQRVLGSFAFIGMLSASSRHVFPFFIHVGNMASRLNSKRIPMNLQKDNEILKELQGLCSKELPQNTDILTDLVHTSELSDFSKKHILHFLDSIHSATNVS